MYDVNKCLCVSDWLLDMVAFCTEHVRAARHVLGRLALSRCIPPDALRLPNETGMRLRGLSGGAAALELFLAEAHNNVVRAFDVRAARLDARDA